MFDLFRSRDKVVRFMLGGLLVLVALSMLTYLIPSYGNGGGANDMVIAKIGKEEVTLPEIQRYVQAYFRARQVPPEMMPHLVNTLVQDILTEYALAYQARSMGMQVTDAELADAVRQTIPSLFQDGKFVGKEAYAGLLAQQNLTIEQFETNLRRQMLATRVRDIALEGTVVTPAEIEREYRRKNEKAKIEYVKLDAAKLRSQVQVTPEEMQAYFKARAASFQIPEKRSLAILVVDQARVEQTLTPTDADLQRMYNQEKDRFRTPERVKVRHILLKTEGKPASEDAAIKAKAEGLLKQIKGGADFAELAKKNSEDPGSAQNGGALPDWITHGQTVPEFDKVAFSLKKGETSDLVKTQYGYHIIQVLDKQDAHLQSFDEVKAQLATEWRRQRVNDQIQRVTDQAEALLKKNTPPEKVAADLNLQLTRANNVAPGDPLPEVGVNPDFEQVAFSLKQGDVSQPVAIAGNKIAIAQVTAVTPAHPASFEDVQASIKENLEMEKATRLMQEKATELYQKAASMGGDLAKAAQALKLEVKTSAEFDRQGAIEGLGPASMVADAFVKPVGSLIGPVAAADMRVVAKIVERKEPDMAALAATRNAIRDELRTRKARERNALFEEGLRQALTREGKIKIHQETLARLEQSFRG